MNFIELMEFIRASSAISLKKAGLRPNPQILYENKKGYCVYFNEKNCAPEYLFGLERMAALRGLNLDKYETYWVVWSPEEF